MSDDNSPKEYRQEKLTNWKQEPSLMELKADLEEARSAHDAQVSQIDTWMDARNVTGKAQVNTPKGNSRIVPKLIRKQNEWRYASLSEPFLANEDIFKVKPVTWEDRDAAFQNQLVLNNQFNTKIRKVDFIDEYVRTAVDEGTVIVRVGWNFQEEEETVEAPIVEFHPNPETMEYHQQLEQLKIESPSQYLTDVADPWKEAHDMTMEMGVPIEPHIVGYEKEKQMKTVSNHPTVQICDYRNTIIDPSCEGDLDKANFVIFRFESSLSELEKDGRYKNLDKINLATNTILGEPDHVSPHATTGFNFKDKPRQKFIVHEYWGYRDLKGSGKLQPFVAAWVGDTLIRMEENPFPDKKLPFVKVQYLPVRRSTYGEPDGALLEDNQKIIGAVTRGMIDLLGKSANGQTGMRKDMLDPTNKRKYEKGLDYEFNANVDPRQGIHMHQYPEIPSSAQFMVELQNREAESLTGVKAFSNTGITGQALGDVATGIRGALDATSKRELGILRRLAQGVIQIGRKFISMNSEFLSEEEVIRITNEEFVPVRRDDLAGKFDLVLTISTAEEDETKVNQLAFLLQTMGNNMDFQITKMILTDIARLKKMPDLAKKIEVYEPQPDPLQQKKAELEIALLEAQIEKERSMGQHYTAQASRNLAQSNTEQAKTGKLISEAELNALNYVEQETGVKQERELEKMGEQSRAQGEHSVLKHELDREKDLMQLAQKYLQPE